MRRAVVDGNVAVVRAYHAGVTCHVLANTGNVNICHDVLYHDISLNHSDKSSCEDFVVRDCSAFDAEVAYCCILCVAEETAIVFVNHIIDSYGVFGAVEDSCELPAFRTQHEVWEVAVSEVNVVGQQNFQRCITLLNLQVEPIHLLGTADKVEAVCVLRYSVRVGHAADCADAVHAKLMIGNDGIAFGVAVCERTVFKFSAVAT